jgi:Fe2+ or Zn2+ uptake regulation protein
MGPAAKSRRRTHHPCVVESAQTRNYVRLVTVPDLTALLRGHGIQPSAHRLAVAQHVLFTDSHPSADQIWAVVRDAFPIISRATVYNTLNLLVEKGLLKHLTLAEGRTVFDPRIEPHHHFIDEGTGTIHDVPWDALDVRRVEGLKGVEVREYQVVLRGRKLPRGRKA